MNKREFLKTAVALVAGNALKRVARGEQAAATPRTNWAGNLTYSTGNVQYPKTVADVQQLVKQHSKLKALGTRHWSILSRRRGHSRGES